jgi:hypothetical protein
LTARRRLAIAMLLATCASGLGAATAQAQPPANITLPTISGNAVEGETLIGTDGTWEDEGNLIFTRQWQRSDGPGGYDDIAGATGTTYTLKAADVGHRIRLQVTATGAHPVSTTVESAPTAQVAAAPEPEGPSLELFVSRRLTAFKRATVRAEGFADTPLRLTVYEAPRREGCSDTPAGRAERTRVLIAERVDGAFNVERRPKMKKPGRRTFCAYLGPDEDSPSNALAVSRRVRTPLLWAGRARRTVADALRRHGFANRVLANLEQSCSRRSRSKFECRFASAFPGYFLRGHGSVKLRKRLSYRFQVSIHGQSFVLTDENEGGLPV